MAVFLLQKQSVDYPINAPSGWRLNQPNTTTFFITINNQDHVVSIDDMGTGEYLVKHQEQQWRVTASINGTQLLAIVDGHRLQSTIAESDQCYTLFYAAQSINFSLSLPDYGDQAQQKDTGFLAPMNATIVDVLVEPGLSVKQGDELIVMEAMKMQHTIVAPSDGVVTQVFFKNGDLVDGGSQLLSFSDDAMG